VAPLILKEPYAGAAFAHHSDGASFARFALMIADKVALELQWHTQRTPPRRSRGHPSSRHHTAKRTNTAPAGCRKQQERKRPMLPPETGTKNYRDAVNALRKLNNDDQRIAALYEAMVRGRGGVVAQNVDEAITHLDLTSRQHEDGACGYFCTDW
jgi:hypothetical protein